MDQFGSPDGFAEFIRELGTSTWLLATISAAVDTGLLDALVEPCDPTAAARRCELDETLTAALLDVLEAGGVVQRDERGHRTTPGVTAVLASAHREALLADLRSALLQPLAMQQAARSLNWT